MFALSRHDRAQTSLALFIWLNWLNENVDFCPFHRYSHFFAKTQSRFLISRYLCLAGISSPSLREG